MPNQFEKFANQADQLTREQFKDKVSGLTRLTDEETEHIINDTGISHQDLAEVLKTVKNDTASNERRAQDIKNINSGVETLIAIAKKFL